MSQHDMVLDNSPGATMRADANSAFQALATKNAGATAPSTTYAYMWWADTTTGRLKQRNATNDAWIDKGPLAAEVTETPGPGDVPVLATATGNLALPSGAKITVGGVEALSASPYVDVASAATVDLGATGRKANITGNVTITGFGVAAAGFRCDVRFDGALILTHNATSLICIGGASITTAAGDICVMESLGSGNWRMENFARANGKSLVPGGVVQVKSGTPYATAYGTSLAIPIDSTIPQNTEGLEIINDCTITPTSATNKLLVEARLPFVDMAASGFAVAAIFRDSAAGAIAASVNTSSSGSYPGAINFRAEVVAGSTAATTFKLRFGTWSGATAAYVNRRATGETLGGVTAATLQVSEIIP